MVTAPLILAGSISIWRIGEFKKIKLNCPNQTHFVFVIEYSKVNGFTLYYIFAKVKTK